MCNLSRRGSVVTSSDKVRICRTMFGSSRFKSEACEIQVNNIALKQPLQEI